MTTPVLTALAISLYISVFLSIGLFIILLVKGIIIRSIIEASRCLYPAALVFVCGLQLDRVQYKLTGLNGTEDIWIILAAVFVLIAAVLRTVAVVALEMPEHE